MTGGHAARAVASLPMYDRAETRGANDRFWALIRDGLRAAGLDAPDALTRGPDPWADWTSPDLILSQTCGLPYRARLHGRVCLVATPVHDLGCPPGHYFSVLVARAGDPRSSFADFAGARLACNDPLSQSGWAAPWAHARAAGVSFGGYLRTGSHRASARAVAEGRADLAALDAVTWEMIRRWDAPPLKVIDRTAPTPALPWITAAGRDPAPIAAALAAGIDALAPEDRAALGLRGLVRLPADRYLDVATPPPLPGE